MTSYEEVWRPVPGYEGFYEVSDHGRVKSLERLVESRPGRFIRKAERVLKPVQKRRSSLGAYQGVGLSREGKVWQVEVHRLVLLAFVGPAPEGMEACHNNGDPADNRLENLRWDTRQNNILDAVRHGTHVYAGRTHCDEGHPYDEENTYINATSGQRVCRKCQKEYMREYMRSYRAKKRASSEC